MDNITDKQLSFIKSLMEKDYKVFKDPTELIASEFMDANDVTDLKSLSKGNASTLINLLASASKYDKVVDNG